MINDFRKSVEAHEAELKISEIEKKLQIIYGSTFYNWSSPNDPKAFNNIIGFPRKNGKVLPLFDYEKRIIDAIEKSRRVAILKATGLGISELLIRRAVWLALSSNKYRGSQFCFVTGPNINLAIGLIERAKALFLPRFGITFDSDKVTLNLNQVQIRAYPSHHLDSMRSLTNPKFFLIDELDFLPPSESLKVRGVVERYIAKSDPEIAFVSTPGKIGGLFQTLMQEPDSIYDRIVLPYQVGLGKIYTQQEIDEAKPSASFPVEYECKFIGGGSSIFREESIQAAIDRGNKISTTPIMTARSIGVDPGFGSSPFGIVITEIRDGLINIVYSNEFDRPNVDDMVNKIYKLTKIYNINFSNGGRIYVDGANADIVGMLKRVFHENERYDQEIAHYKHLFKREYDIDVLQWNMFTIPIPGNPYNKEMLAHLKGLFEYQGGIMAIHPRHDKLITSIRSAVEKGDGSLDKNETQFDNVFDALRLSAFRWQLKRVPRVARHTFATTESRLW
jgi:hypothetical protein